MKDIIIIGAGGQGRETVQLIKDINDITPTWNLLGFVDDNDASIGKEINGFPVLGDTHSLLGDNFKNTYVICAIGQSRVRKIVVEKLKKINPHLTFATLVHPSAVIGDHTFIGTGTMICAHTVVTVNIQIGDHVLINYGSTIGHDTILKDYCTVLPGSNISGNVVLEECVDMGSGAAIIPGVVVGKNTIIGAGAVVAKPLPENCTAVGVPAKPIKYHKMI